MGTFYPKAFDFIRYREFDVIVPAFYHPNTGRDVVAEMQWTRPKVNSIKMVGTVRPPQPVMYSSDDPHRKQFAKYAIVVMLDMFESKISFELQKEEDLPEILTGLDRYLNTLKDDIRSNNEDAIRYARLVVRWREQVYKHFFRYMNTDTAAAEGFYPNRDKKKNILSLLSMTTNDGHTLDPIRALAEPPYLIDDLIPGQAVTAETKLEDLGSSLGLSTEQYLTDDGRDFDMAKFMSGKA